MDGRNRIEKTDHNARCFCVFKELADEAIHQIPIERLDENHANMHGKCGSTHTKNSGKEIVVELGA